MKKILAILLAVVMTFSMLVPATAALNTNQPVLVNAQSASLNVSAIDEGASAENASKLDGFFKTFYEIVHAVVHFVSAILDFDCPFCGGDKDNSSSDDTFTYEATQITAAELKDILTVEVVAGCATVEINDNYFVTDDWTSIAFDTGDIYIQNINSLTVKGNGHVIAGLTAPLFAGNTAINISIEDLTIADSKIANAGESNENTGAFLSYVDSFIENIKFENCNVINTEITSAKNAGSFIGYASSHNFSVKNCTAKNVTINATKSAAGIVGFCQTDSRYTTTVENSKVVGCSLTGEYAGQIVGTANGNGVFNAIGCEFTGDVCDPNRMFVTVNVA